MPHRDIVVIGASAGGLEVLRQIPPELRGEAKRPAAKAPREEPAS